VCLLFYFFLRRLKKSFHLLVTCYKLLLGQEIPLCCLRSLLYGEIDLFYLFSMVGYTYIKWSPVEIQTLTLWHHIGHVMTACVIAQQCSAAFAYCAFISARKKRLLSKALLFELLFLFLKNCISQGVSVTRLGSTTSCLQTQLISSLIQPPNTLHYMIWVTEFFTKLV